MANTYEPIATNTLSTATSSVTFSSIPGTYTDLVLIITGKTSRVSNDDGVALTFNSDTLTGSTNYSFTTVLGVGGSGSTARYANNREINCYIIGSSSTSSGGCITANIMNYSNTTTYKTVIEKGGIANSLTAANVGMWRNSAAITSMTFFPGYNGSGYTFATGSTFTLYGIKAA